MEVLLLSHSGIVKTLLHVLNYATPSWYPHINDTARTKGRLHLISKEWNMSLPDANIESHLTRCVHAELPPRTSNLRETVDPWQLTFPSQQSSRPKCVFWEHQLNRDTHLEAAYLLFHLPIGAEWTRWICCAGQPGCGVSRLPLSLWSTDTSPRRKERSDANASVFPFTNQGSVDLT